MITPALTAEVVAADADGDTVYAYGEVQVVDINSRNHTGSRILDLLLSESIVEAIASAVAEGGRQSINLVLQLDDVEDAVAFAIRRDDRRA